MPDRAQTESRWPLRDRWLTLGIIATVALAALVVASLTGILDRGNGSTKRGAVSAYIDQVNAFERDVAADRQQVSNVYANARADPQGLAGNMSGLEKSVVTLRRVDRQLRALKPPPEALTLQRKLVALSSAEARLAMQIVLLAHYLPALGNERKRVGTAGSTLRLDLRSSKGTAEQAIAFDRFATRLEAARNGLRSVRPPDAIGPARTAELAQTAALADTARKLGVAIRAGHVADARQLLHRLAVVAAGKGNAVERRAVIAFDAQVEQIDALRTSVAVERVRLDRVVR